MSGYFLYHSIGTFPGKAEAMAKALVDFSAVWSAENDGQWPAALGARDCFIRSWAQFIDAPEASLTTTENVTAALYSLIGGLPADRLKGKRLLVAGDCFPSLHFLLAGLAERFGFTLDTVPLRPGETWVRDEDMLARWQDDVGLALLTFVSSTSSHLSDVRRLAAHGRRLGSVVGVDVTQGIGIVPFSLAEVEADFVVSTSLKWLCGASGAGILQVAPALLSLCRPELRGWFSQPNPFSWALDRFAYADDIRRFDHGTPGILSAVASQPGLDWMLSQGVEAIARQNRSLTEPIVAHALERGWTLASPAAPDERGGSVMLLLPAHLEAPKVLAELRGAELFCDARGQTLRISPGTVSDREAVERLLGRLDALMGARQALAS